MTKITDERQSREERMIVLERDETGKPTVWCDPEIADIVGALNRGGVRTIASCSGHGHRPGSIALADGRWLVIAQDDAEHDQIEAIFPTDINGEPTLRSQGGVKVADGWVLVPKEPTAEMIMTQGKSRPENAKNERTRKTAERLNEFVRREAVEIYREMIAAAPVLSSLEASPAPVSEEEVLAGEILTELVRARTKFPGKNVTFAALIEEVGELATATFEEGSDRVRKEAVQVAVMAMRMVLDGDHTFDQWREEKGLDALASKGGQ